jgi:hypothetical protein
LKRRSFLIAGIVFFISACGGYKPIEQYSKAIFNEPVLVKVKIDPEDPASGEYLEDEIAKMATNRLNLKLTNNVHEAKSYIIVNNYTINTTTANKDDKGNVIRYSVNAAVEFAVEDKLGFWSKNIVASEFVSVKAQSLISAQEKEKASKIAIKKAVDDFLVAIIQRTKKKAKDIKKIELKEQNKELKSGLENNKNLNNKNFDEDKGLNIPLPIDKEGNIIENNDSKTIYKLGESENGDYVEINLGQNQW